MHWRLMQAGDVSAVFAVSEAVHPDLPESREVIAERLTLYPKGCWVLEAADGTICGYAISHPIARAMPPALNQLLVRLPEAASDYYIHDIAILPAARGGGRAVEVIEKILNDATAYEGINLISVYGTASFWQRFAFKAVDELSAEKLASYGDGAVFMRRAA